MQEKKYEIPVIFKEKVCRRRQFAALHTFALLNPVQYRQISACAKKNVPSFAAKTLWPARFLSDRFHEFKILIEACEDYKNAAGAKPAA